MRRCLGLFLALVLAALATATCRASIAVDEGETVFRLSGIDAEKVFVVGDFNGWNPTIDLMAMTEGLLETRLFLLPGTYRYRFIADGVSLSDPDNPCLDAEGNSCFTLTERDGVLEIFYAKEAGAAAAGKPKSSIAPSARIEVAAADGEASVHSAWGLKGTVDERIDADLAIGLTEEYYAGEDLRGRSFLLRSLASYRFDRGTLSAFARPCEPIDLGDMIGLLGAVGPYRYPVSLFSRGVKLDGTLPLGIDGRFIFASRLRGYRSGLEGSADSSGVFAGRLFEDSDIYALRLGAKINSAALRYLFRENRRPKDGYWRFPALGGDLYEGFERDVFHGFSISLSGDAGMVLDGELLFGKSFLAAENALVEQAEGEPVHVSLSRECEWEHGRRFLVKASRGGSGLNGGMVFSRTTLEGDRAARDGRCDGSRTSLVGTLAFRDSSFALSLEGTLDQYSSMNTGSIFWVGRTNFWLNGDELSYDLVPFLSSRQIYEIALSCERKYEPFNGLPWGKGLRLEMKQRWSGPDSGPIFREIRFSNGVPVHRLATFLLDMRGASYSYGGTGRDFVDVFLSLHGSITKSIWCAVGTGVNPYAFDEWLYAFSDHGREDYLYWRGVLDAFAAGGEQASMKVLFDAEDALADDWAFTIEAGFTF
ncbi:MAG: glycogen-binding domain-containing protein [Candidatus Krumholzibacteria bacterium]|nr:glycogen-binding domain-containing protein [Candidatus Krumholzibacteria bacterium]